jgi:hypothetical protein
MGVAFIVCLKAASSAQHPDLRGSLPGALRRWLHPRCDPVID